MNQSQPNPSPTRPAIVQLPQIRDLNPGKNPRCLPTSRDVAEARSALEYAVDALDHAKKTLDEAGEPARRVADEVRGLAARLNSEFLDLDDEIVAARAEALRAGKPEAEEIPFRLSHKLEERTVLRARMTDLSATLPKLHACCSVASNMVAEHKETVALRRAELVFSLTRRYPQDVAALLSAGITAHNRGGLRISVHPAAPPTRSSEGKRR